MNLTPKQENFCHQVAQGKSYSDAYRIAYNVENMSSEVINKEASILMSNRNITVRVSDLQKPILDKVHHTVEQSILQDLNLISTYEDALSKLKDIYPRKRSKGLRTHNKAYWIFRI